MFCRCAKQRAPEQLHARLQFGGHDIELLRGEAQLVQLRVIPGRHERLQAIGVLTGQSQMAAGPDQGGEHSVRGRRLPWLVMM